MKALRNILIIIGIITVAGVLALLILGIKIIGTLFMWVVGFLVIVFIIGFVIFQIGKTKGRRTVNN